MKVVLSVAKGILLIVLFGVLFACNLGKRLDKFVYLKDLSDSAVYFGDAQVFQPIIRPGDRLAINVSALNPESAIPYNVGSNKVSTETSGTSGYRVEADGTINFPQLGSINAAGLTIWELHKKLTGILMKYLKDPLVTVQFLNYKITMLGEINRPGVINIPDGKVNIIEAIGLGGDMTIYGRKDNVLVIREKNGKRQTGRLDLNSVNVFKSDYFFLEQNDIVYVEPIKEKVAGISDQMLLRNISIITTIASLTTTMLVFIISLVRR